MPGRFRRALIPWTCLIAGILLAQNPTATLVGTVRDATGAVVADAALEVRNTETGDLRSPRNMSTRSNPERPRRLSPSRTHQ